MRGRRHKLQVSTFPFLAVLLCAMGSLILVLLVMDRKAHKAAQARALREAAQLAEKSAQTESERQVQREKLKQQALKDWEQKRDALHEKLSQQQIELQLQMRKVREELQGIAARLHYEQDTTTQLRRKTQDERSRLQAEEQLLRTLRSDAKLTDNQSQESSRTLRRMTLDLLQMEQVLKDLKASKQREQKTFSVVPYHGRRGENRRPLYVECTADGVIFHPERKAMSVVALVPRSSDSTSEVRAEVERRIAQQRQKLAALPSNVDRTPYLLLLLRPSGVTTYHLLQRALRGLPLDFGYEFIDEDWVLDFPADDELPSTQPWMIATKTPSRPAIAPSVAASPAPRTSPRPMGGLPTGSSVAMPSSGFRGFRAGEAAGNGSWGKGDGNTAGSPASGPAGAGPGMSGGGGISGSQTVRGSAANWSDPRASASGQAVPLADARGSDPIGRGNGHGHPSAMPPRFPSDEGGMGDSGEGVAAGGGVRGIGGMFPLRGSNSGSGPGPGFSMGGATAGAGTDLPGLGPPRALASGLGEGYAGGSTAPRGMLATGSTGNGNGVPGNGWSGGTGVPGIPGAAPGTSTSADGRFVIARGNNGPDTPVSGFRSSGDRAGTGGSTTAGTFAGGGSSSGASINYDPNFGVQGSGSPSSGAQMNVGGSAGGQTLAGTPMPGSLGGGGSSPTGAPSNNAAYAGTQGAAGFSPGSGQAINSAGGAANASGAAGPGAPENSGSPTAAQINNTSTASTQGMGGPAQGAGSPLSDGTTGIGGSPSGQTAAGGSTPANGSRTSDVVIFVDPLTGKPTDAPRPAPSANDASAEGASPSNADGNRAAPRIRVIPVTSAASGGGSDPGDDQSPAMNRFSPAPSFAPAPPRRLTAPRPGWIHGGRDWTIYVECRGDHLVLYPSQRTFTLAQATSAAATNPLIKAIQQMIDRRQSSRRPGEPPYHPQICLLVRPDHIRTFLTVYPALEALPVPKTRRNLDADDDVISIVTGAVP